MGVRLGAFELDAPLGAGAMGWVYRAVHADQRVPVAVKVDAHPPDHEMSAAFLREVQIVAGLDHANVAMILDHGVVDEPVRDPAGRRLRVGARWLAMELAAGGSTAGRPPASWVEVAHLAGGVLAGLAHAHARGVVHRDIKPANVLLAGAGTAAGTAPRGLLEARPLVADFGISARRDGTGERADASVGSPRFMAPELIEGRWRDQGPWTDLYAVGVLLWLWTTGAHPFDARSAAMLFHAHLHRPVGPYRPAFPVPDGVEGVLRRLLAKDPSDRPEHASEVARALELPLARDRGGRSVDLALHGAGLALFGLRTPPFVGRQAESRALWDVWEDVQASRGVRAVLVRGQAGIGASRLLEELGNRVHEEGSGLVVRARGTAEGCALAGVYGQIRDRMELRRRAGRPIEDDVPSDPRALRQAVLGALFAVAGDAPVLVVLDEVDADLASLDLIDQVVAQGMLVPRPLCVVAIVHPERLGPEAGALVDELADDPSVRVVDVEPLDPEAADALVRGALGLEGALTTRILARTAGHPQFTLQLLGSWVAAGSIVPGPDGLVLAEGDAGVLPEDLAAVWRARVERVLAGLGPSARIALELAAAWGDPVDDEGWRAVCPVGTDPEALVAILARAHVLRLEPVTAGAGRTWRLAHGAMRELLEADARAAGRWASHHRAIAAWFARSGASPPAIRRAWHLVEGRLWERAVPALFDVLNDQIDQGDVRDERWTAALEAHLAEVDPERASQERAELDLLLAMHRRAVGDLEGAGARMASVARCIAKGREAAPEQWSVVDGKYLREAARLATARGDLAEALALSARGRDAFLRMRDDARAADCASTEGHVLSLMGRLEEARRANADALEGYRRARPDSSSRAMIGLVRVAQLEGDRAAVEAWLGAARADATLRGHHQVVAVCANLEGEQARADGRLDQAAAHYLDAIDRYRAIESIDVVYPLINLAILDVMAGRDESAQRRADAVLRSLRRRPSQLFLLFAQAIRLVVTARAGEREAAAETCDLVLDLVERTGLVEPDLAVLASLAADAMAARSWPERHAVAELARRVAGEPA